MLLKTCNLISIKAIRLLKTKKVVKLKDWPMSVRAHWPISPMGSKRRPKMNRGSPLGGCIRSDSPCQPRTERRVRPRILLGCLWLLMAPLAAWCQQGSTPVARAGQPQSLGELARQQRAQRATDRTTPPAKVYTNDNLPAAIAGGELSIVGPAAPQPNGEAAGGSESREAKPRMRSRRASKDGKSLGVRAFRCKTEK